MTVWPQCRPAGAVLPSGHCVPKVDGGQWMPSGALLPSGHRIGLSCGQLSLAGAVLPSGHSIWGFPVGVGQL
ncbi:MULTISPECIES: hypothetical protein [unclassified Mycobacterium]|uniref:hypothetical protein n=1 Tax=unclassified Mycobacterium TaxID=2642494 RepID=UPI0029C7194D|nr:MULTISPECIES: hypothetical protein [unclassified Mycobacterium]